MKPIVLILSVLTISSWSAFPRDSAREIYDAIRSEDVKTVKTAISADTNVVNLVGEKQFTTLHFAAEHRSLKGTEILELLLANGAKIEARNHVGQTPLFSAVIYDNAEGAKILIDHDAKVNARQEDGRTPLHWAALNGYCDVAKILIQNNASLTIKNSEGKTALELALEQQKHSHDAGNTASLKRYQKIIILLRQTEAKK